MIFSQILIFIVSIVCLSLSISGYGALVNSNIKKNFFLDIFLGLVIISLIIKIIHFFFNINLIIAFSIFTFGILIFISKKKIYFIKFI